MKIKKTINNLPTDKELNTLWAECVKERAGRRSEYSGKTDRLNAHHILGKASQRLRWELENGVCITGGEHKYIAHGDTTRKSKFEEWALRLRALGDTDKMTRISALKWITGGVDKFAVKIYLEQKLAEFKKCERVTVKEWPK